MMDFVSFCDADFAGGRTKRKSTSGYVIMNSGYLDQDSKSLFHFLERVCWSKWGHQINAVDLKTFIWAGYTKDVSTVVYW